MPQIQVGLPYLGRRPEENRVTDPTASFATLRAAAGALFLDGRGWILLVRPTYKPTWEIPGGMVESGESPAAACRRELAEELGIDRVPRRLLAVDWAPDDRDGDKLLFLFDCGPLGDDEGRLRLPADELDRWEWVDLARLDDYVSARLGRRVRAAVEASAVYLEHGQPPQLSRRESSCSRADG